MKRATIVVTLVGLAATAHADVDPVLNVDDRVSNLEATVAHFLVKLDELSERHESLVEKHNVLSEAYVDLRGCVLSSLRASISRAPVQARTGARGAIGVGAAYRNR